MLELAFRSCLTTPKPKPVPNVPRLRIVPDVQIVYRIQDRQGRLPCFRNCENVEIRPTSVGRMLQPFLTSTATRSRHSNGSILRLCSGQALRSSWGSVRSRRSKPSIASLRSKRYRITSVQRFKSLPRVSRRVQSFNVRRNSATSLVQGSIVQEFKGRQRSDGNLHVLRILKTSRMRGILGFWTFTWL
jgi:hypothetical protein